MVSSVSKPVSLNMWLCEDSRRTLEVTWTTTAGGVGSLTMLYVVSRLWGSTCGSLGAGDISRGTLLKGSRTVTRSSR